MKKYLFYFINDKSDPGAQALALERQMTDGHYDLSETPEQTKRNEKIASDLVADFADLYQFENPFGEMQVSVDGAEEGEEAGGAEMLAASIEMSDSHGMKLELVGDYIFIILPDVGSIWESELVAKRLKEIAAYCQKNYDVLIFDVDALELVDF